MTAREGAATAPGQAAYEAGPLGWVGRGIWPPVPWEQLDPEDRKWWNTVGFAAQAAMPRYPDGYPALAAEILDAFTAPTAAVVGNGMIREWRERITAAAAAQPAPAVGTYAWQADTFVRASAGQTVLVGFRRPITPGEARDVREHFAEAAPGVNIVIIGDVESIDVEQPAPAAAPGGPCPGCESLRRQHAETCGEVGFLAGALSEIARRTAGSGQGLAIAAHGIARDALERLHAGGAAPGAVDAPAAACDASDLEVAGIIVERNRFRDALEQIREIILDAGSSDNGSRLRRSRAVIRAALEDR